MKLDLEASLKNLISQLTQEQKDEWEEINGYPFNEDELHGEEGLASVLEILR